MEELKVIYVTVGTTQFDGLISSIVSDQMLKTLQARNCKKIVLQHGNSPPVKDTNLILKKYDIEIEQYTFRPNASDIIGADLIIGHAGAGTCMDILNNGKHGLIVVNDGLMDNHQLELAQQLARDGYLYYCHLGEMPRKLGSLKFATLKPYVANSINMQNFVKALNDLVGSNGQLMKKKVFFSLRATPKWAVFLFFAFILYLITLKLLITI